MWLNTKNYHYSYRKNHPLSRSALSVDGILGENPELPQLEKTLYIKLCNACKIGTDSGTEKANLILWILTPCIFEISDDLNKLKNYLHESLILRQFGWNGIRFDRNGLSLDAIAEVFLGISNEKTHKLIFSHTISNNFTSLKLKLWKIFSKRENPWYSNEEFNLFLEHPGLIPYADILILELFPFEWGMDNCFVWAGGNGIVLKNPEANLAYKFYFDPVRKQNQTIQEWPSQLIFYNAVKLLHETHQFLSFSIPSIEALKDEYVEMELVDWATLDTLFKRYLLTLNNHIQCTDDLSGADLDQAFRKAWLHIEGFTICTMLECLYDTEKAQKFKDFIATLQDWWLTHLDIDWSLYSDTKDSVNPKNLMIKKNWDMVLIDFWNVEIKEKTCHLSN